VSFSSTWVEVIGAVPRNGGVEVSESESGRGPVCDPTSEGEDQGIAALALPVSLEDLAFRVGIPEGCELVVALRTPSGQLLELCDLSGEGVEGEVVGTVGEVAASREARRVLAGGAGILTESDVAVAPELVEVVVAPSSLEDAAVVVGRPRKRLGRS
jgi:hypothetical protein